MLDKVKAYLTYVLEGLVAILTLAFLYEKSRKDTAEAQVAEQETQKQVQDIQKQVDNNDAKLAAEEEKRAEIKKEAENAKSDNNDSTDILSKR